MDLLALLRDILSIPTRPKRPACRLSETEAFDIAADALGMRALMIEKVVPTARGVEWHIGTATRGAGKHVTIDDQTGAVLEVRSYGGR